jgi:hypothetical protein
VAGIPLNVVVRETVPHDGAGHDTLQLTPLFATSLVTVAVTCVVEVASTLAELAATATEIAGIVIVADPDAVGSLTEMAIIVTCKSLKG